MNILSKSNIREFLNEFCDEVYDMPYSALELIMDDHKCIQWYGRQYFVPENNSYFDSQDDIIWEHLVYNFGL